MTKNERLLQFVQGVLSYDPIKGEITNINTGRILSSDEKGFALVFNKDSTPRLVRVRLAKAAILLSGLDIAEGDGILHRNLDKDDIRLRNLLVLPQSTIRTIHEAAANLDHAIRMVPHHQDQWSYVVHWREDGKVRKKIVADVVSAKKLLIKLRLRSSKVLTKYCLFD